MHSIHKSLRLVSMIALVSSVSALSKVTQAQGITSGTGVLGAFHLCTDSTCTSADSRYQYEQPANPGDPSASMNFADTNGNSVYAYATLGSPAADGAPVLGASSTSALGNYDVASAVALQSYTWDGTGSSIRTFSGTLEFSQTISPGAVGPPGVGADIDVFTLPTGQLFNAGVTPADNMNALLLNFNSQPGSADLINSAYSSGVGGAFPSVTINLVQGQTYWVWTLLQAASNDGGSSNAADTFVTQWNDTTGLTPAATVSAPEIDSTSAAGGLTLLVGGLVVLGGRKQRTSTT